MPAGSADIRSSMDDMGSGAGFLVCAEHIFSSFCLAAVCRFVPCQEPEASCRFSGRGLLTLFQPVFTSGHHRYSQCGICRSCQTDSTQQAFPLRSDLDGSARFHVSFPAGGLKA